MKSNKGITLVSLVIYIAIVIVVTATVIRITTYFKNNMEDVADVGFETEFQKINLYLLEESKTTGNGIDEIINGTKIIFTNGNKYEYKSANKTIYLNDTIKVCENVESCAFTQKTAENGKSVLGLTIKIGETTKTVEYVLNTENTQENEVNIDDYLIGASKVSYYLKAGDYVDYTPDTGTYKVADGEYGSGYTTAKGYQEFTTETGANALKWRILSIDEQTGKIELISETVAQKTTPLCLSGADGYNHGVDILNDLCETLYSKTVNGKKVAVGRSINVEDIDAKTTFDPKTHISYSYRYGKEFKFSEYGTEFRKYPNLYEKEDGFYIEGKKQTGGITGSMGIDDGITTNGVTEYKTTLGYTDDWDNETNLMRKDVSVTFTYYFYYPESDDYLNKSLGINMAPKGLINIGSAYFVASRCIHGFNEIGGYGFDIRLIYNDGSLDCHVLLYSKGSSGSPKVAVRPVVTLDATQLLDFTVGDGSIDNPWGMK